MRKLILFLGLMPVIFAFAQNVSIESVGDGKVLLSGGCDPYQGTSYGTAQLLDTTNNQATSLAYLQQPRCLHHAVGLPGGRLLVYGGLAYYHGRGAPAVSDQVLSSVEIWDPRAGRWLIGPEPEVARAGYQAVLLQNGQWVVLGGISKQLTVEAFDTEQLFWKKLSPIPKWPDGAVAEPLSKNRLLVFAPRSQEAFLYSWDTDTWNSVSVPRFSTFVTASSPRYNLILVQTDRETYFIDGTTLEVTKSTPSSLLDVGPPLGRVAVTALDTGEFLAGQEIFDPATQKWSDTAIAQSPPYPLSVGCDPNTDCALLSLGGGKAAYVSNTYPNPNATNYDNTFRRWYRGADLETNYYGGLAVKAAISQFRLGGSLSPIFPQYPEPGVVSLSPSGHTLLESTGDSTAIVDLATGNASGTVNARVPGRPTWSQDERFVAIDNFNSTATLLDLQTQKVAPIPMSNPQANDNWTFHFLPGRDLISVYYQSWSPTYRQENRVYESATMKDITADYYPDGFDGMLHPGFQFAQLIQTDKDGYLTRFGARTVGAGKVTWVDVAGQQIYWPDYSYSPDGNWFEAFSRGRKVLTLYHLTTVKGEIQFEARYTLPYSDAVYLSSQWSQNSRYLLVSQNGATGADLGDDYIDTQNGNGRRLPKLSSGVNRWRVFDPEGRFLAVTFYQDANDTTGQQAIYCVATAKLVWAGHSNLPDSIAQEPVAKTGTREIVFPTVEAVFSNYRDSIGFVDYIGVE